MSQKPVVVPIERYAVLIGAYGSRDPGRAPSQNIQIFHSPPDHDLRTILVFLQGRCPANARLESDKRVDCVLTARCIRRRLERYSDGETDLRQPARQRRPGRLPLDVEQRTGWRRPDQPFRGA
jgi:hypothetical protein